MPRKKITMHFKSEESIKTWEAILRAKEEVDNWPAWKRGKVKTSKVDELAKLAGLTNGEEAYERLDNGEFDGTMLEMELRMLRFVSEHE